MSASAGRRPRSSAAGGQALVEFALASTLFFLLVMLVLDFGRAVYTYNGVAEAAREIARVASVHPGTTTVDASPQVQNAIATQRRLIPGMGTPVFTCVDIAGSTTGDSSCLPGEFVKVSVTATYAPSALFGFLPSFPIGSSSSIQMATTNLSVP